MKKPRRVKLGKVPAWTEDDLDRLAEITDADRQAAAEHWHKHAGRLARLLDAEEQEPDATDKPANP